MAGILCMAIDYGLFLLLIRQGFSLGTGHILSFGAGMVIYYACNVRPAESRLGVTWRLPTSFFAVALMAMFLRGGVVATFSELWGWPSYLAILPAIALSALIGFWGYAFFLTPSWEGNHPSAEQWRISAIGMIGYAFLLRLFYLGTANLLSQEAYYWNYAQHLDIGYLDHPPMVAWVIWLWTALLGDTEFAVRAGAFLSWLGAAFFCFRLTRNLFDSSTALRALLLLAILPFFFGVGFVMTPDGLLVACWAGMLYFLERALLGQKRWAWWGAGVCAGLGMLSKYTISLLGPPIVLFMLMDRDSRRLFLKLEPYGALTLAFLLFLPVIIWNAEHQWVSFIFQGSRRFRESLDFTFPELIGSLLLLLTPTGMLAAWVALRSKPGVRREGENATVGNRRRLFVLLFTLVPFVFFATFSLVRNAKLNWTGPLWLAVLPSMAWGMVPYGALKSSRPARFLQRAWLPTCVVTLLFLGIFLHFWVLGLPGVPYPKVADLGLLSGWKDLTQQVEKVRGRIEASTGRKPFVVGLDKCYIASQIIFHRSKHGTLQEKEEARIYTTGRHLFGMDSLMYRFWFPQPQVHKLLRDHSTLILVARERNELKDGRISSNGWEIGEIQELQVKKNGMTVGYYYYALAKPRGESHLRGTNGRVLRQNDSS